MGIWIFKHTVLFYFHVFVSWIWYNGTENKRRKRDRNYSRHSWPCITHKKEIHGNICQNTILCIQSWAHHFEISLGNQQGCNLQINVKTIDLYIHCSTNICISHFKYYFKCTYQRYYHMLLLQFRQLMSSGRNTMLLA